MVDRKNSRNGTEKGVGRGNPPKHTRFRKGMTGNPKGRPRGSKNLSTLFWEAARGQVTATINGKQRKITNAQATTLQLATQAAGGNQASMGKFLDWMDEFERRAAASRPAEFPFSQADLEVLSAINERMNLCIPPTTEE